MKKLLSIILSTMLLSGMTAYAVEYGEELRNMPSKTYEQKFSDVPQSHWAFGYIAELVNDNVLSGYPDGKFYPSNNVTRAEFAKIMISASGVKVSPATSTSFSDVATTDWFCPYIESAKEFLTGYNYSGNAMYLPNKAAIREDIAVALVRLKGYDISVADLGMLSTMFSDYDSISETAKRYVAVAVARGLVSGYEDGTFKGQQSITRAEAATLIWRANQYGADNKILGSETETIADNSDNIEAPTAVEEESKTEEKAEEPAKEEKKPYIINKLASADVSLSQMKQELMTADNSGNIYYIEKSDNCVYKLDTSSGKKTKFFDIEKLSLQKTEKQEVDTEEEVTETVTDEETGEEKEVKKTVTKTVTEDVVVEEYSKYVPYQLEYDTGIDKLIVSGCYTVLEKQFQQAKSVEYYVAYDITNKADKLLFEGSSRYYYGAALNSEIAHAYSGGTDYSLNFDTKKITYYHDWNHRGLYHPIKKIFKVGSNMYALAVEYGYGNLCKYDFSSSEYVSIANIDTFDSVSRKNSNLYFWYKDEFSKMSVNDGKISKLDINTKSENVEFADMGSMKNISETFFVIDDNKIILYDNGMKAFRLLQKNK